MDRSRRVELGEFCKHRRSQLQPRDVGLLQPDSSSRRRVRGLRRDEVAGLAHISVDWYTWIEQGRQINVSTEVIDSVTRALRIDSSGRDYIRSLTGAAAGDQQVAEVGPRGRAGGMLQETLAAFDSRPAAVLNNAFDIIDFNEPYRFLATDLAQLPSSDLNCAVLSFLYEDWNLQGRDREALMRHYASHLKANRVKYPNDASIPRVIARLAEESPEFRSLWSQQIISDDDRQMIRRVRRRDGSVWAYRFVSLWEHGNHEEHLVVMHPAEAA